MIPSFPKIFAIGSKQTEFLFDGEVEITEKIDGSQIGFGIINEELIVRSKGQQLFAESCDKMFRKGADYIESIQHLLVPGFAYYGEYLKSNKHNCLIYDREPKNNIMIYGILDISQNCFICYEGLKAQANLLGLESVPLLYQGKVNSIEELKINLNKISVLGNSKIEGIVVKNYKPQGTINQNVIMPILMGKYVSEEFKEVHNYKWKNDNTGKGKFQTYKETFRTDARWVKAIQHLRESGSLSDSPKDIGNLLKEIQSDISIEEKENIKEWLWKEFGNGILRHSTKGFPQWYKERLLNAQKI